jgi:hypothetical protein
VDETQQPGGQGRDDRGRELDRKHDAVLARIAWFGGPGSELRVDRLGQHVLREWCVSGHAGESTERGLHIALASQRAHGHSGATLDCGDCEPHAMPTATGARTTDASAHLRS